MFYATTTAWQLTHQSERDRRAAEERIGRLAASVSRRLRPVRRASRVSVADVAIS
jgi:hypothetical protein